MKHKLGRIAIFYVAQKKGKKTLREYRSIFNLENNINKIRKAEKNPSYINKYLKCRSNTKYPLSVLFIYLFNREGSNSKLTSIFCMEMAPRLFSIILNVSPWFGRMTFYWSGPAMAFSPLCMRVFPSRDEVSPERTWEKNRCLPESSLLWPLENNGGGGKFARYCYLTVDRSRL